MASPLSPLIARNSEELRNACEGILIWYSGLVLNEAQFANPGGSGLFTVYNKRQELARKVIENPKLYAIQLAGMIGEVDAGIVVKVPDNGQNMYEYLYDGNPTSEIVTETMYDHNNWNHVWPNSWTSLFDKLAGISNEDTL